jgi:hypothetical protein
MGDIADMILDQSIDEWCAHSDCDPDDYDARIEAEDYFCCMRRRRMTPGEYSERQAEFAFYRFPLKLTGKEFTVRP